MGKRKRIFYIGMVNSPQLAEELGLDLFIGAGSKKMADVNRALRISGQQSWIVSLPTLGSSASKEFSKEFVQSGSSGSPAVFLPVHKNRWLRKFGGACSLLWFCATRIRGNDRVIFYNAEFEYLPAALWLRLQKNRAFIDVEDLPTKEKGIRNFARKLFFPAFLRLCRPEIITVSRKVAQIIRAKHYLIVHGLFDEYVSDRSSIIRQKKWQALAREQELRIHFGGTLTNETGLNLFCDAVKLFARDYHVREFPIRFIVTTHSTPNELVELAQSHSTECVSITIKNHPNRINMIEDLIDCHVSLSLKLQSSNLADTTFPSKVIEVCSGELLLVATPISDIPRIFDQSNSFLLNEETSEELCRVFHFIVKNPGEIQYRAEMGRDLVRKAFNAKRIGSEIADFLVSNQD